MKKFAKIITLLMVIAIVACAFVACDNGKKPDNDSNDNQQSSFVDYVSQLKLDLTSNSAKITSGVSVKLYVDGDTTHFFVPSDIIPGDILKARYIAINTPESTGKIEDYGHAASRFTRGRLSQATSIILESDTTRWEADSTGSRYLTWVWYKTADDTDYRNLNLEILQEGLARTSATANNRYGTTCMNALLQAQAHKLNIYSDVPDPEVYRGSAVELTLKELRTNIEYYQGTKVAFEGVVARAKGGEDLGVYVEDYDEETDQYYGVYIYAGFNPSSYKIDILQVGNRVRIVGSVEYWEAGGTYQISDLNYRAVVPNDPNNIQKIGEGYEASYSLVTAEKFANGTVRIENEVEDGIEIVEIPWAQLAEATSISMEGLYVVSAYTTTSDTNSNGAITLTCRVGNIIIKIRTDVLYDNGVVVTQDRFVGKTINVKGLVEYYKAENATSGTYQIKVLALSDITIL